MAERQAAAMVTNVSAATKAGIRAIISRSIREGIAPLVAATLIQELIGLTAPAALAAMTFRATLIESGLTLARVDKAVARYITKKTRERSKTIARTEIMGALNGGVQESFDQAQKEGFLDADTLKEWITTPDDLTCPICEPLDGQKRPIDRPFNTSDGEKMNPPAHVACRCTLGIAAPPPSG